MRKVDDGEKRGEENNVGNRACNIVDCQPPKRQPTGMPTAHARIKFFDLSSHSLKTQ